MRDSKLHKAVQWIKRKQFIRRNSVYSIEFRDGAFRLSGVNSWNFPISDDLISRSEVIGNIYEPYKLNL